jgi:hypothetical protein
MSKTTKYPPTQREWTMTDNDLEGIGEHYGWDDVRGWLTFSHLPDELQRQMDATQNADHERRHWRPSVSHIRAATTAERLLLTHLGFTVPTDLDVRVRYPSGGIRRLEFPALIKQQEAMQ